MSETSGLAPLVGVVMGSKSDLAVMEAAVVVGGVVEGVVKRSRSVSSMKDL